MKFEMPAGELSDDVMRAAFKQLHACVEDTNSQVSKLRHSTTKRGAEVDKRFTDLDSKVDQTRDVAAETRGMVEVLLKGFSLPTDSGKVAKPTARLDWQTLGSLVGATGGAVLLFKLFDSVWPAIHHALLTVG